MKPFHSSLPTLGVDIGRVLIDGDGPDTSFLSATDEGALLVPAMAGAFAAMAVLCRRFEGRVHLVSKCGPRIAARSRAWLHHHRFFARTGVSPDHLRFCKERRQKAGICLELGIDFFVDDRLDVLLPMAGIVTHRFHFGAEEVRDAGVTPASTWAVVEDAITRILDEGELIAARRA